MRISMIGCGYLGAVHAASMAEIGHDVVGIDVDEGRISALAAGTAPFFEPGFEEVLSRNVASGRLRFTTDISAARGAQVHFIGVGTPQTPSGAADMTYVDSAVEALVPHLGHCQEGEEIVVPLKNGEGNFIASPEELDRLEGEGLVVFRYIDNPNGSARDIAGVRNERGNVVGLMPHPEHAVEPGFGPDSPAGPRTGTDGLRIFHSVLSSLVAA